MIIVNKNIQSHYFIKSNIKKMIDIINKIIVELNKIAEKNKIIAKLININAGEYNIYILFTKKFIGESFKSEILGYHLICESPIKEAIWEEINCNIVNDYCKIIKNPTGSHLSGRDNIFDNWRISNKTGKIVNEKISLSSYRLGNVCNIKNVGNPNGIINEINNRNELYDYYSILLRDENIKYIIIYYWFIIPKDYHIFNIDSNQLLPIIGVNGKNKDKQIGWKSKYATITFSMSSQLWFNFNFNDIKQFLLHDVKVDKNSKKYTYSDLYNLS